jgi:hypothetical protein
LWEATIDCASEIGIGVFEGMLMGWAALAKRETFVSNAPW